MRLHVASLPHTETTRAFEWCAYTAKVRKFCDMMTSQGHEVVLYAGEANEASVSDHVVVSTRAEVADWFPDWDYRQSYWSPSGAWDPRSDWWETVNERVIEAVCSRADPGDYLCVIAGVAQRPLVDALPDLVPVEWGVGYRGVFAPYRVFESYAWAHHLSDRLGESDDARLYDAVIPNSFEADAFPLGDGQGGYFLFMGRLIGRKGLQIAGETCRALGARLVVAGQGMASVEPGRLVATDGTIVECDVEYVGLVGPEERASLMGGAVAVLAPTTYLEPFGGVAVEAMLTGTPAITTDWGAFTETVPRAFRGRRLQDFVDAARRAGSADRPALRDYALRYSTQNVAREYDAYFRALDTLRGAGWYSLAETA